MTSWCICSFDIYLLVDGRFEGLKLILLFDSFRVQDSFDGNSMKVAELLVKNGFKEAYAIRGGIQGKNGWQACCY